jgi:Icc protein
MEQDVDAILISGDIADKGSVWAYDYVDKTMASLGIPTYGCPGNHDNLSNMIQTMKFCRINGEVTIGDWNFVIFDSTIQDPDDPSKNRARGELKNQDLDYIEHLASYSESPVCVVLHHSPIEPGGWMNKKLLENREEFKERISRLEMVKLVLFGHIHYPMTQHQEGTIYSSAPSVGFAFDKDLPKYQICDGNEGYNVLHITGNNVEIHRVTL